MLDDPQYWETLDEMDLEIDSESPTPQRKASRRSPPTHLRRSKLAPHLPHPGDADLEYVVRDSDGRLKKKALPIVSLSFDDFESSVYFKGETIQTPLFSDVFRHMYAREMEHINDVLLADTRTGYKGSRTIEVVFKKNGSHCISTRMANMLDEKLSRLTMPDVFRMIAGMRPPSYAETRALESAAMTHMVTEDLPRTERVASVSHWVVDSPGTWFSAKQGDKYSCTQWLDTHSHPAWFWRNAKQVHNHYVLLRIKLPEGTPALRAKRYNSGDMHVNLLRTGQWTYSTSSAKDNEVRLPPGIFTVLKDNTKERFAGHNVLLVTLAYRGKSVGVC